MSLTIRLLTPLTIVWHLIHVSWTILNCWTIITESATTNNQNLREILFARTLNKTPRLQTSLTSRKHQSSVIAPRIDVNYLHESLLLNTNLMFWYSSQRFRNRSCPRNLVFEELELALTNLIPSDLFNYANPHNALINSIQRPIYSYKNQTELILYLLNRILSC